MLLKVLYNFFLHNENVLNIGTRPIPIELFITPSIFRACCFKSKINKQIPGFRSRRVGSYYPLTERNTM